MWLGADPPLSFCHTDPPGNTHKGRFWLVLFHLPIHHQCHSLQPWRNSYSQKHLLLFISRFTVTAKQIFLFLFLPSILFSFFLFFTIWYHIFLPFVRFLWSSITIWFFNIRKDSYFFCSCQWKEALLPALVSKVTTVCSHSCSLSNSMWTAGKPISVHSYTETTALLKKTRSFWNLFYPVSNWIKLHKVHLSIWTFTFKTLTPSIFKTKQRANMTREITANQGITVTETIKVTTDSSIKQDHRCRIFFC